MENALRYLGTGTKVRLSDGRVGYVGERHFKDGANYFDVWEHKEDNKPAWVVIDQTVEVLETPSA